MWLLVLLPWHQHFYIILNTDSPKAHFPKFVQFWMDSHIICISIALNVYFEWIDTPLPVSLTSTVQTSDKKKLKTAVRCCMNSLWGWKCLVLEIFKILTFKCWTLSTRGLLIDSDVVNTEGLLPGAEPGVPGLPELPPLDGRVLVPGSRGAAVLVEGPATCTHNSHL